MLEIAALYAGCWTFFHIGAGYLAHRLPMQLLTALPLVNGNLDWEDEGKLYERFAIRGWKDHLPEAGAFFSGGFSKRRLSAHDAAYLQRFAQETARAECSHWLTWGLGLSFFAWNPWEVGVVMMLYGAAANLPCILVQRYNRARLRRAAQKLARRAHRDRAVLPAHAVAHQGAIE